MAWIYTDIAIRLGNYDDVMMMMNMYTTTFDIKKHS